VAEILLFPEKEAKSDILQKTAFYPKLGEADPGGWGASPQVTNSSNRVLFFFQKKKQKALVQLRRR
jgi:hypothetical protein